MSPRVPQDRKLSRLIKSRVMEEGLRGNERVLFLDADGNDLQAIRTSMTSTEAHRETRELLAGGRLAAVIHLFPAWDNKIQFGVVEIFDGSNSTIHGILSSGDPQWIQIPAEISDQWSRTWNRQRKE